MNLTEKVNCGKLKLGVFNRKAPRHGAKPFIGLATGRTDSFSKKDSTPSSKVNWGKSRQSISSSGVHSEASMSKEDSRIVLALSEGRGEARCEVGIAVINVSQPHLILCQISDTQSYDNTLRKINIFNPSQILIPMTFVESANQSRLIEKVKEQFSQVTYTPVRRNTYNKINGMEFIQEYCVSSLNSVLLVLQYRHYALTAASALFRFLQNNLNIFYASGSIKIDYQESEGYAVIDVSTADRLELVSSTKPLQASKYSTLFGVLNNCYTRIGERALRTILLQPPFLTSIILERQECVTALIRQPEKLLSIQVMLQKLGNVDQLLTLPTIVVDDSQTCSNRQLNYILYLNGLVHLIITLSDVISSFDQTLFRNISVTLKDPDFLNIREMVRTLIHENAYAAKSHNGLLQRCFAIKPGINGLLDLVRKIYSERLDDMREYVKTLGEKYDLPLTLGNNITKGYHIVFSLNKHQRITMKKSDIPREFIQVCRLAGSFTMKTMELINFQTRIDDIIADILKISNVMIFKTLTSFKKYMGLFYRLCEDIAIIDVLQSLAEVSLRNNYVKPIFSDFTEVKESQHPMLDMLAHEKPVPNLISSCQNFNIHIITGPNGSGKSIYIRQLMLLQIMAQIGGYVPALSAVFRPADRMFARVYLEDNMECGASSFVLEMKEIIYILSHITDSSLIIIDELARSTSLEEGAALAMAICECFVNTTAFVYLTSHFTLVTKLGDMYLNVKNWFMDTEASGDTPKSLELNFKHTIKTGVTNLKRYGIFMVKNIWPADLLEDVYALLEHNSNTQKEIKAQQLSRDLRIKYNLDADAQILRVKNKMKPSKINEFINHDQIDNLNMSSSYEEQVQESVPHFDDSVPDDVLSEVVDQVEYSLMSQQVDSDNTSYKQLSHFIAENSANIHLLNPEIHIEEPSFNIEEGTNSVGFNFNERKGTFNQNIQILSNVILKENNKVLNDYPYCNDQLEHQPIFRGYSQETDQNSQDFEEINEINRSLLTEMQIAKKNFREINSENPYEDTLTVNEDVSKQFDFMETKQEKYDQKQKITGETHEEDSFESFVREENQVSDFCFLKPSEPPLRKRFNFKTHQSPMNDKTVNFDETDQMTFSLGLIQDRDKTSTPITSRKYCSSQEDRKMNFTDFEIDNTSYYSAGPIFSQENSQPWVCEPSIKQNDQSMNVGNHSQQSQYVDSIDDVNNKQEQNFMVSQKYNSQEYYKSEQNMPKDSSIRQKLHSNSQQYESLSINEGMHIFPEVNILEGPNNKSLSFGEEDKPNKTLKANKLNKNIKGKNDTTNKDNIDKKLEQFIIEETKMFLSDSADIFDGDVDELEITIENIEHSRKSHEELSENVICILKSELISSRNHKKVDDEHDEILIQDTQSEVPDEIDGNSRQKSVESEIKKINNPIQNLKENEDPEVPRYLNVSNAEGNLVSNKKIPNETFKLTENLFEATDLETFFNHDLIIPKTRIDSGPFNVETNSEVVKLPSQIAKTDNKDELIRTSILYDNRNENKSEENPLDRTLVGNTEVTEQYSKYSVSTSVSDDRKRIVDSSSSKKNSKNTVSTSLSEASKKRNLDDSSSASTSDDQNDLKICNKKKKLCILQHDESSDVPNSSSKSPKSIDEIKKISTPSKILISENDGSDISTSRDKATTSISDASRKRNLDNPTSASTSSNFQDICMGRDKNKSFSRKLSEFITSKTNKDYNEALMAESMPEYPQIQHKNSDDDYKECEEVRKESDSSYVCYETAVERDLSSEKSDCNGTQIDGRQRKQYKKGKIGEIHSKRYMSTSKCSTETISGSASMHFESVGDSSSMSRNIGVDASGSTFEKAENRNQENEAFSIEVEEKVNSFRNCSVSSNEDSLNEDVSKKPLKKKKYLGYGRRSRKQLKNTSMNTKKAEESKKCKSLFKPVKLTKYQIQEEFNKQDQIILEKNLDVETYNKYLMQRMNRPSAKQIQNAEHIATFRRTKNGTILLPTPKKIYKPRTSKSTKVFEGNKLIDVSIFSDQNADKMSAFLASKERNYNQFMFEQTLQGMVGSGEDSCSVNFCSQFVQKSDRMKFNRSKSFGEFKFQKFTGVYHDKTFEFGVQGDFVKSQQSQSSSIFLPEGYLKDNKKDIDLICSKYLDNSNSRFYRTRTSPFA